MSFCSVFIIITEVGSLLWVDKYRPQSTRSIIGQQGDRSNAKKLSIWLQNWNKNHGGGEREGVKRPPWGGGGTREQDGSSFKAALLSGPPGIGKTSTATLVCKVQQTYTHRSSNAHTHLACSLVPKLILVSVAS